MLILTEQAITELIAERKQIPDGLQPISRMTERNKHLRREYELACPATGNSFVIKLRRSTLNPFDFSVILGYRLPGLIRFSSCVAITASLITTLIISMKTLGSEASISMRPQSG